MTASLTISQCLAMASRMKEVDKALFISILLCGGHARTWTWAGALENVLELPSAVYYSLRALATGQELALAPFNFARHTDAHWLGGVKLTSPIFKANNHARFIGPCTRSEKREEKALTTQEVSRRFERYGRMIGLQGVSLRVVNATTSLCWQRTAMSRRFQRLWALRVHPLPQVLPGSRLGHTGKTVTTSGFMGSGEDLLRCALCVHRSTKGGEKMIPSDTRLAFLTFLALGLSELLFGILYNWAINNSERFPKMRALTAWSVVIGDTVTLVLVALFFQSSEMWHTIGIVFYGYVWSGLPMIAGHRARYIKALAAERERQVLQKAHKRMRWPNEMSSLRDTSAEEAMAGLKALNGVDLDLLSADQREKIWRGKKSFSIIIAKLIQAGAQVDAQDL